FGVDHFNGTHCSHPTPVWVIFSQGSPCVSAQLAEHQAFWAASVLPGGAHALCPRGAVATGEHAQLADLFWREPGNVPRASVIGVDHEYCHSLGRYRGSNPAAASAFCSVHRPRSSGFTASSLDDTSHIPAWSIHFTSAYRAKLGASRNVPAKPATRIPKHYSCRFLKWAR